MRRSIPFAVAALLAACTTQENAGDTTGATTGARSDASAQVQKVGETGGLRTPESVKYDPDQDVFFISNIDGNPSQKDGKASIVKVRADSAGTAAAAAFIEGGRNGVTLNAPKGMAIQGDTLWVADIDAVRGFDRRTGAPVASIELGSRKASFLNDIAVGGDGALYITDTGISFGPNGEMSNDGTKQIFKIVGRTVTQAASGDSLRNPNGIAWDAANNRFALAAFSGPDVLSWTPGSNAPTHLASGPGQYDGVEIVDDMVLVSSWADSAVHVSRAGAHQLTKLISGVPAPADIGVDTKRRVVAVPLFSDNKVEYYRLP